MREVCSVSDERTSPDLSVGTVKCACVLYLHTLFRPRLVGQPSEGRRAAVRQSDGAGTQALITVNWPVFVSGLESSARH